MCSLYSAGSNACGQLAHGSREDSHIFRRCTFEGLSDEELAGSKIMSIAAGANHTLLLLRSVQGVTQLWGSGSGQRGQLGARYRREFGASFVFRRLFLDRDEMRYDDTNITLITASWETSFVVVSRSDNDALLSVGSNEFGDLGVGGLLDGRKETEIWREVDLAHLLPNGASNIRISQLKAGPHTILAKLLYRDANMREAELIVGWGAARQGQLGANSKKAQATFHSPQIVRIPSRIDAFAVGSQHTVFLTSEGSVLAFGSNKKGQLRGLDTVENISAVGATWNGTYLAQRHASADKWSILATGSNSHCQLARSSSGASASEDQNRLCEITVPRDVSSATSLALVCGSEHILVSSKGDEQIDDDASVLAWGWNEHGNLSLDHTSDVDTPTKIWPSGDRFLKGKVAGVWAGCATSWIGITGA